VAVFEHVSGIDQAGLDPVLTTHSDYGTVPRAKSLQVVAGDRVKVALRNTETRTFYGAREYEGRTMVAGMGATPTLQVGDFLTPGTGDDTAGYWAETGSAANAWLVVENVDLDRGEVECRFLF
jgi:hypothetical protein